MGHLVELLLREEAKDFDAQLIRQSCEPLEVGLDHLSLPVQALLTIRVELFPSISRQ